MSGGKASLVSLPLGLSPLSAVNIVKKEISELKLHAHVLMSLNWKKCGASQVQW